MNGISATQLNTSTFNYNLPNNDDLDMRPLLRIPAEIGDNYRVIATAMRYKVQSYSQKGGFYIFVYNLLSRNYFNNPEYIMCVQQAIDGAANTVILGGMANASTYTTAVNICFTGAVARLANAYQNDPNLGQLVRQITNNPDWPGYVDTYNKYLENEVNSFLRLKQQRLGQQQQPQQMGYNQPMQQQGYVQPQPMQQGYVQPQYGQQPNVGMQQSMVSGQAAMNNQVQTPMQHMSQTPGIAPSSPKMMNPYEVDEPQAPENNQSMFDLYQPVPTTPAEPVIDEISNHGVVHGTKTQNTAVSWEPSVPSWDEFDDRPAVQDTPKQDPIPKDLSEVCFIPGAYGEITHPDRPYSRFVTNGNVIVYSHSEARRQHIKVTCVTTYDMTSEVGFVVIWPNGKTEFKTMPISKETTYCANEIFERNKLFDEDDFSEGYQALQEFKGGVACPREYRDLTDKELQDHEPLTSEVVMEGETDEERDTTARETVRERDGALTGVVSYHNASVIPLNTDSIEGLEYLQIAISEAESMTDVARSLKRLVKDKSISPAICNQLNHRLTTALNAFFRSEVNERIVVDSFIGDVEDMMNDLQDSDAELAKYMDSYTTTFVQRVLNIKFDPADDEGAKAAYIEEDQLSILLPLHSLNFTIVTMQEMFGVCFAGPKHQKVHHLIEWHLRNTKPTRIRLVTVDGVELWATAGMNGKVMLTVDPQHI